MDGFVSIILSNSYNSPMKLSSLHFSIQAKGLKSTSHEATRGVMEKS